MRTFSSFFGTFLATYLNEKITKPLRARLSHGFKMWGSDFVCLFWRENTNEVFFKRGKFARPFWKKANVVEKWHKPCSDLRQVTHFNTLESEQFVGDYVARFIMCRYTLEHSATHFNSLLQIGERAILIGLCGWVTHHFLSSSFEPLSAQLLAKHKPRTQEHKY